MITLTSVAPNTNRISEYVELPDGRIAHRYNIIGTRSICYDLWIKMQFKLPGDYSTITSLQPWGWLGEVTTRRLPPEIDALPVMTTERSTAVRAYHEELRIDAESVIRATFPNDFKEM